MSNDGVIAVEKAMALLDCYQPGEDALSLTEMAIRTGFHKTTTHRLLKSLERMRYVVKRTNNLYALGPRLLCLGKMYEASFHISNVVQPVLHRLAESSGESASWYIIEDGKRLCLLRAEPPIGLIESRMAGTSYPLDESSISQVLRYWGLHEPLFTAPPTLPLYTSGIRDPHIAAFSIPVFGDRDKLLAALCLSGPSSRLTHERQTKDVAKLMHQTAMKLSRALGASDSLCKRIFCGI